MTQLLVSVKNLEESFVARHADVDVIDLKDPSVGALGALDAAITRQVVQEVGAATSISATVGEGHESVEALVSDIKLYAGLGVDVVKMAVSDLFINERFLPEMHQLSKQGVRLVAVFFADSPLDFSLIPTLQKSGFYGAMIDTQAKQFSLLDVQPIAVLKQFIALCVKHQLISGLAGSVNKSHVEDLQELNPTFIGMRGGVCDEQDRTATLSRRKVNEVKALLLNYNSSKGFRAESVGLRLHI